MGQCSSKCTSQQQHRLSPSSMATPVALGREERGISNTGLQRKQLELLQVWQFSREHKNPSNDCKSVAGLCKQLWGAPSWGTLGAHQTVAHGDDRYTVASAHQHRGHPDPDRQPACPSRASGFPGSLGLSWDMHWQNLPCREDFGPLYIYSFIKPRSCPMGQGSLPGPGWERRAAWLRRPWEQHAAGGLRLPPVRMRAGGVGWCAAVQCSDGTGRCRLPEQRSCSKSLPPR